MRILSKSKLGAVALIAAAVGTSVATTTPAEARVSFGIGIGVPGPYYYGRPYYADPCASPRFRYYHPGYCYNPGYYDSGYYDYGYYGPGDGGFWITDSFGHRRWHSGRGGRR